MGERVMLPGDGRVQTMHDFQALKGAVVKWARLLYDVEGLKLLMEFEDGRRIVEVIDPNDDAA